jgi:hypothetical protein
MNIKMYFKMMLVVVILATALVACNKDDDKKSGGGDGNTSNHITVNGKTYSLDKGFVEYDGDGEEVSIALVSSSIDYDGEDDFVGIGEYIQLVLISSPNVGLVSGKYTFSEDEDKPFTFSGDFISINMDCNKGPDYCESYWLDGGTIEVKMDGNKTTMILDLKVFDDVTEKVIKATGYFQGVLKELD